MNLDDVRRNIAYLADHHVDNEGAHCLEDDLYYRLLASIADGSCDDAKACAAEAIKSKTMNFVRWCA